jgi:uncharacterized membrane protein
MTLSILRRIMIALSVIGLGLATYLTVVHYAGIVILCTTAHNSCEAVQTSVYSKVAGVPVALLGAIGYVCVLTILCLRDSERTRALVAAITFFGFGFSAYLTYREVFSLHEICEWCVSSAILMTILFALALTRYLLAPPDSLSTFPRMRGDGLDRDFTGLP